MTRLDPGRREGFRVLGIHDGHNASACLLVDGELVAAMSEERISRLKNEAGYPRLAIEKVLDIGGCDSSEIDLVALGSRFMHHREFFFNWDWYRKGHADQLRDATESDDRRLYFLNQRLDERKNAIVGHLGIPRDRITIVEHHTAHAAAAYFGSPWAGDERGVLVLTLDGSGDGVCATVSIGRNGQLVRLAQTGSAASLGKIYSRVTFLLGMKPWEHEYKLMGLAPYADESGVRKSYEVIRRLVTLDTDSLVFRTGTHLSTNYCYPYLRSELENHRFDWIAGAIQQYTEDLTSAWISNAVAATGVGRVACGGGVFMNVKMNMRLLELENLEDLFVFPSCGDESISIGAAYSVYADRVREHRGEVRIPGFRSIYLGPEFSDGTIETCVREKGVAMKYWCQRVGDINDVVARLLAAGEIVGRFDGRMEWGARANGNRSILVDPRRVEKIKELNAAIKHRDFWMPFAPTILATRESDYVRNRKSVRSPYMMLAFQTTEQGGRDLAAARHPYDGTVRPQLLERDMNPKYYDLVQQFEAISGVGALLNTSFNLHGEPLVCSPEDALGTFERSGIEILVMGDLVITKKRLPI